MGSDDRRLVPCPRCGQPMAEGGQCDACSVWADSGSGAAGGEYAQPPSRSVAVSSSSPRPVSTGGRSPWFLVGAIVLVLVVAAGVAVYVSMFRGAQQVVRTEQEQLYYADVAKAQTRIQSQDAGQIIVLQSLGTEPPADQLTAADRACADIQAVYAEWKDRAAPSERLVRPTAAWVTAMGNLAASSAAVRAAIAATDHATLPTAVQEFSMQSAKYAIAAQQVLLPGQ